MSDFTEVYGSNPGISIAATRNVTNGNLGPLPVLLRSSDLGPPSDVPLTREYPMEVPSASSNVRTFDPDIRLPWALTGTFGIQRALSKIMSVEARFVHTDSHDAWTLNNLSGQLNYNETMVVENGFLDEYAWPRQPRWPTSPPQGLDLAYTGRSGNPPTAIFLANLNGLSGDAVNDPTKYTGSGWTNSTLVQNMYALNPGPLTVASNLRSNATYKQNLVKAGYPFNFWQVNPDVTNATVVTNGPGTRYNGIQLVFNQRYSKGVQIQANYTYGKAYQKDFFSFRKPYVEREQSYTIGTASLGNVRHSFSVNWLLDLPFGQGKRFAGGAGPLLNRIIGDWSFMGIARVASGRLVDFGNVRNGRLQPEGARGHAGAPDDEGPEQPVAAARSSGTCPDDVVQNTIKAVSASASTRTRRVSRRGGTSLRPNGPDLPRSRFPATATAALAASSSPDRWWRGSIQLCASRSPSKGRSASLQAQRSSTSSTRVNFNPNVYTGSVEDSYQITAPRTSSEQCSWPSESTSDGHPTGGTRRVPLPLFSLGFENHKLATGPGGNRIVLALPSVSSPANGVEDFRHHPVGMAPAVTSSTLPQRKTSH